MKLFLALLLNVGLLWWLVHWVHQQRRATAVGPVLLPALALKLAATAASAIFLTEDAGYFQYWAKALTRQLWTAPVSWMGTLWGEEFHAAGEQLVYHGHSNTFFVIKLLSVLNLGSLGSPWLNAVYLSIFCFVGCWQLVRILPRLFPATPAWAAPVAFLLWPTVLYWTSGITKESLLVGALTWLTALVVDWLYGRRPLRVQSVLGGILLILLGFKMRYFFAVLLFAALLGLAVIRLGQRLGLRRRWAQVALVVLVLVGGSLVLREVSPLFRFNRFSSQLLRNYYDILAQSRQKPHIEYSHLGPTWESVVSNSPMAVVNTLLRPWPWESLRWNYLAASLENMALLGLLVVAFGAWIRGRAGHLPFALVLVLTIFCLGLAVMLGLSTPNLGTLSRYRTVLLPFLLLLLLQNDYVRKVVK